LASDIVDELNIDDSVAVNGICLTVTAKDANSFTVDAVRETVERSTCRYWQSGRAVHLERGLLATGRLDGHIVQGHVDGIATLTSSKKVGDGVEMTFACESKMSDMMVEKGSIAIDGVSLTIAGVKDREFCIAVIPFTLRHSLLGKIKKSEKVNIETDILGKYIMKFMTKKNDISKDKLRTWGYTL
jgi:riboflavin synthase